MLHAGGANRSHHIARWPELNWQAHPGTAKGPGAPPRWGFSMRAWYRFQSMPLANACGALRGPAPIIMPNRPPMIPAIAHEAPRGALIYIGQLAALSPARWLMDDPRTPNPAIPRAQDASGGPHCSMMPNRPMDAIRADQGAIWRGILGHISRTNDGAIGRLFQWLKIIKNWKGAKKGQKHARPELFCKIRKVSQIRRYGQSNGTVGKMLISPLAGMGGDLAHNV